MIECVFTIDYEIYGNGEGSLKDLVYEPASKLIRIFEEAGARFVCFVEAAEFERIEELRTDPAIHDVRHQIQQMHQRGFEIALHLHPQWYNAGYRNGHWELDYSEYNLCTLPKERIVHIVERATAFLRDVLGLPDFTPLSFRAGNWLFQPTRTAASVLADHGIKIDSSVFKGGVQHKYNLDYRRARRNGSYWPFKDDVNVPDPTGVMVEIPIYSEMVPLWRMVTKKRVGLQKKGAAAGQGARRRFARIRDFMRLRQPLKFDFCRMTLDELTSMTGTVIREDQRNPETLKPMVAIGHTKDLEDFETVRAYLDFLKRERVTISTFEGLYPRLLREPQTVCPDGVHHR